MKIAHVVSTFPPHIGGMGAVCYNEAKLLAENGHDVTVFTLKYPGNVYNDTKFPFKVMRLNPFIRFGHAGLVPQILNHLKNFDIIHLHYPFYGGAEWLCFSSLPLVVTYHMDAQVSGLRAWIQKVHDRFWPNILFAQAKKIIAVDREHFKYTKFGKVFSDKTIEIKNGVDVDIFYPHPVDLGSLGLSSLKDKKIVLFVGNLMPVKRLDLLLESLNYLNDDEMVLVVVGGGYELDKYEQITKDLQIENKVNFVGPCYDQKKLSDYYNIAACVVVPSDYESFSLVTTEAMACGVPIVASMFPGIKNKIDHEIDGFLFEPGSKESLAGVLKKIASMTMEERRSMGQKARTKMENNYSWDKHLEKLTNLYKSIVT